MTPNRTVDVSNLPAYNISNQAPLWWGQFLMCAIEGTLFCTMIATYFYLRMSVDVWPPPGVPSPGRALLSVCRALK